MNLISISISHHTAPLEVREKMWLSADEVKTAVGRLKEQFFAECVLVSTCNRTELYGVTADGQVDEMTLKRFLIDIKRAEDLVKPEHFVESYNSGAVSHLFKVASAVDSMVIGDIQILGQLKEAFTLSRDAHTMGPIMNRLMQSTLHVGKRVRTETAICEGAVSISYAAVELACKIFADLSKKSVLLVGAGETGELTLTHLVGRGIGHVKIANRTREKADALAAGIGGTVVEYDRLLDAVRTVDIVVTSVNSSTHILRQEDVGRVMRQRSNNPLFIIDIGVPRNVDPAAKRIENVFCYDIDTLSSVVDKNLEKRTGEVPKVTRIVREELVSFFHWLNSLEVGPAIQEFREALESIRLQEVEKNINRFRPEDRELLELVTKRIVNKILHQPTTVLKQGAENGGRGKLTLVRVKTLRELFGMTDDRGTPDEG